MIVATTVVLHLYLNREEAVPFARFCDGGVPDPSPTIAGYAVCSEA
jgi:hypothetical protein